MNAAETLLSCLDRVRARGPGQWIAKCPAHEDREPSLSIRECADGTVLVKCFAGCGAIDVVQAVGLKLVDLFPPRFRRLHRQGTRPPPISWADVIRALRHHLLAIGLAAGDIARGKSLSIEDARSLSHAAAFVLRMIEEVNDVQR